MYFYNSAEIDDRCNFIVTHGNVHGVVRKIIAFDDELQEQTMYLRKEGEIPFLHPSQLEKNDE